MTTKKTKKTKKTKTATTKKRKPKTKITEEIKRKIFDLKQEGINFYQIGKALNIEDCAAKRHYYQYLEETHSIHTKETLQKARIEEEQRIESMIAKTNKVIRKAETAAIEPDWTEYANNPMARAKAYETYTNQLSKYEEIILKGLARRESLSKTRALLLGLNSAQKFEVKEISAADSLDAKLEMFLKAEQEK